MGRLATSVVKSAAGPRDNPHRLKSEAGGWDLLERLHAGNAAMMRAELSAAAGHPALQDERIPLIERRHTLDPSLSLSYAKPINVVRGSGTYLFDERGRRYLDCVNNVAHVGHSHPAVVAAALRQAAVLNTNTRYLHDEVLRYAERLTARLPDGLEVVFLVNSGSEANELAIRLIRAATGNHDLVCLDGGYHGNTTTLVAVSPYKYPPGAAPPPGIHVLPSPDPRRHAESATGLGEASQVAGLIAEAIQGSGGQIMPEPGFLADAYAGVRDHGGLVIADEVQTGFGRVGSAFWAFELQGVVPDVVTLGKPMGNGHPVGAVVTTREIAEALDVEYFNTFGGNPVSAAVANAVLEVIEDESLQANAAQVGSYLLAGLATLAATHPQIADVRGAGLFLGAELISAELANHVVEQAKERGVLLSADGVDGNVLKIKPPLVFSEDDADTVVATIEAALTDR
jgi:4-aminobutyrate aminotransferase-like enzyme